MSTSTLSTEGTTANVVLVHGALVDGSGWRAVYDHLLKSGIPVSVVNQPVTSREADLAAVRHTLDLQSGPVVLVGHSYGGSLITELGVDPRVKALVYVAALQPDTGESPFDLIMSKPAASKATKFTADGFAYVDPEQFSEDFAADVPADVADFMAHSQNLVAVSTLQTPVAAAAWRDKPSFAVVATKDQTLNPELQRSMYERSGSKVTEIESSHAVYIAHPEKVADVIRTAVQSVNG